METYKNYYKLILLIFVFFACRQNDDTIPYVPVNIQINLQNPDFVNLKVIGEHSVVTGGSKGIIIYRADLNVFKAYDRHCTYQPQSPCSQVKVDKISLMAIDTCCGSRFQFLDGAVMQGPASRGLKEYKTSFDGNILSITN